MQNTIQNKVRQLIQVYIVYPSQIPHIGESYNQNSKKIEIKQNSFVANNAADFSN